MFTFLFVYLRDRVIRNTPPVKPHLLLPTAKSTRIEYQNYYPYSKLAYTQSQNVPYLTTTDTSQIPANCANQEDIFPPWVVISVLLSSEHLVQRINCKLDLPLRRRFSKMSTSWSTRCFRLSTLQHHIFELILSLLYDVSLTNGPTDSSDRRSWEFLKYGKGRIHKFKLCLWAEHGEFTYLQLKGREEQTNQLKGKNRQRRREIFSLSVFLIKAAALEDTFSFCRRSSFPFLFPFAASSIPFLSLRRTTLTAFPLSYPPFRNIRQLRRDCNDSLRSENLIAGADWRQSTSAKKTMNSPPLAHSTNRKCLDLRRGDPLPTQNGWSMEKESGVGKKKGSASENDE